MQNVSIPILWKFEHTKECITKHYHTIFTQRGKKKPIFYLHPIKDVFVFDRIYRVFEYTEKKGLFDENVNFEAATNEYCNGFKVGYKEFADKVSKDLRYNEGKIFDNATQFFSPVSWYPHTYKDGKIIPQNWDVLGEKIGRFYAAWCIVLENQNNFEPLFEQLYTQQQTKELPKELQTDTAKALFQRAIKAGFVEQNGNLYKWKGETKQLLAYFAERMSKTLNLSPKLDKGGNDTTNWKAFEIAFNIMKLKSAKNDWMKVNTLFTPNGYEKIDLIFV
jgi:hypothetical protein